MTLSHAVAFAPVPAWVASPLSHGGAAVDMFFALSGFVIVRSWETHGADSRAFLSARIRRIYPAYLVVLLVAVPIQLIPLSFESLPWATGEARYIWSGGWPQHGWTVLMLHVSMAHGLVPDGLLPDAWVGWLGSAWSLSTEWQFYLLVAWFGAWFGRGQILIVRLTVLLLCLAIAGFAWDTVMPAGWRFSRAFLPNKAAYFALGVASTGMFYPRGARWWVLLLALETCLAVSTPAGLGKALPPLVWLTCVAIQRWPAAFPLRAASGWLGSRLARRLGALSFSLYLVNEPVQKLVGTGLAWVAPGSAAWFTLAWLPLALVTSLAAAALLHRMVEEPFQLRMPTRRQRDLALQRRHAGVAQW